MQRFERKKERGLSDVWEIGRDGRTVTWRDGFGGESGGTVRTNGQTKKYASVGAASGALAKMVAAKRKQGFRETPAVVFVPSSTPVVRNPELEAAIRADLDDDASYLVYADWLTSHGDPRGELVTVQHALETATGKRATTLRRREQALLAKHHAHLFGRFPASGDYPDPAIIRVQTWRRGFFRTLRLANDDWDSDPGIAALLDDFLELPSAQFVDEIRISVLQWTGGEGQSVAALTAIGKAIGPQVRTLVVGYFERGDNIDNAHFTAGNLGPAWKRLPALESLRIHSGSFQLGKLELPQLRELELETCGLARTHLRAIAGTPRPKLEKLVLWFGSESYGADARLKDLAPILEARGLPRVTHLGLMNCEWTDAICEALPSSKILRQLRVLDLSMGCMGDAGALAIAAHPDAFRHLEELRVDENFLSPSAISRLGKLGPKLTSKEQKDVDDSTGEALRYVSVSE